MSTSAEEMARSYMTHGVELAGQGRLDEAAGAFDRAVQCQPGYADAYTNLGTVRLAQGRLDEAIDYYRYVLQLRPHDAEGHYNLGAALQRRGLLDEAAGSYHQALQLQPERIEAWTNLGGIQHQRGDLEAAVACYEQVLRRKPDFAEIHSNLGSVFLSQGRLDLAVARLEEAVRLKPEYSPAHQFLQQARDQLQRRAPSVGPGPGAPLSETERRKQVIASQQTDVERWGNAAQLDPAWNHRAQQAADFLPAGTVVLDLGCGSMALERCLPLGCRYIPCDVVARDGRTLVCDFNKGELPPRGEATHVTLLGALEYIYDLPAFLKRLRTYEVPLVFSYNATDFTAGFDRGALGWVNRLRLQELIQAFQEAGFTITTQARIDGTQTLLRAVPGTLKAIPCLRVVVLSGLTAANFGDRLGFHLINELLPAHATVQHAVFNFSEGFRPDDLPSGDFDLLVLGIGNSMFDMLLTDELMRLLERAPRAIGIFGTQCREGIDPQRLQAVLDRLEVWFARFEEDVLLYGRGRKNVVHLGDWLISAFPMSRGARPETLNLGQEIMWEDGPLDRLIQRIQSHRRVFSLRLHPLLCALTSAEQVAYREQREHPSGYVSGKFRSLFIDIFGQTFPEDEFFAVDRDAVVAYKVKVQENLNELRRVLGT